MMAVRGALSTQRQLTRELQHRRWLKRHLPRSAQLQRCERRILTLRSQLAMMLGEYIAQ
jgi:hypothetical protein